MKGRKILAGAGAGINLRWLLVLCLPFLFFAMHAAAQEATLVGTVTDPSGAVVPNVTMTITHLETGQVRTVTTGANGEFVAPALAVGRYTVKATAAHFKVLEKSGIVLNVGDRVREDFQLELGTAQENVTVESSALHIQTETGEMSSLISGKQIAQLTTNGKSIYNLVNLAPGASSLQSSFQVPTPVGGDAQVSFNGQRVAHNIYLLDGGENLDRGGAGTFSVMPSLESLGEFRMMTSNYSAEYGLSSAATVTTVLKSGAKQFHGSAWEFNRNDALDARNYFIRPPQKVNELRFNTYGFNISGPVSFHPNTGNPSTFFFYNMEWRKLIQGGTLNTTVPMPATYGGNFASVASSVSALHTPCTSQLSADEQARFTSAGITLSTADPKTKLCSGSGAVLQSFPSYAVPTVLLDANAQSLLNAKIFPAPTNGAQFTGGNNAPTDVREEIVRVDRRFGDKFTIFGHWIAEQINQGFGTFMWSGDNVPSVGNNFGNPSYSGVIHATHTINPNLLNEMAFNYNGNRINITPVSGFGAPVAAPSDFTFNRIFTGPNNGNLMPSIHLANTGTNYTADRGIWTNKADDYQVRDDLSWVRGAQQLKFGASWALYKKIQDAFAHPQGDFEFNGYYTGNDFADFLLGLPDNYQEDAVKDAGHWNNVSWAVYGQDNWRVTTRLTLNLGLRWDGVPHTYEANHRASNFYPELWKTSDAATFDASGNICTGPGNGCAAASPGLGTSPNPILSGYQLYTNGIGIDGKNGIPKGLVDNHWAAFGPRVGFAYDATGAGKTVVRGGFGMMYERIQGNDMYDGATNVPFSMHANVNNVLLSDPHTSASTGATVAVPVVPSSITGLERDMYKLPVVYQYSVGLQQELNPGTLFSLSYVGSQSRHQSARMQIDLPPESQLAALIASGGDGYNQMVKYPGFRSLNMSRNEANGQYNSMQASLNTTLHNDLQAQFGYTLSKAYDPATNDQDGYDLTNVSNPYAGWKFDWGPSNFDKTHVGFVNFIYDAPFFRDSPNPFVKTMLGGWSLSGIVSMQSGPPINVTLGGTAGANQVQNAVNRPDLTGKVSYPKKLVGSGIQWFNPSAFSAPTVGDWGNLKHNALRGPGAQNWNLALRKNFNIAEKANFEFRAEAFNVWNHTQFAAAVHGGGFGGALTGSNFGVVTAASDPRVLQLGGKLSF